MSTSQSEKHKHVCYLIHFDQPIGHANHYIGCTIDLYGRMIIHHKGRGSRLIKALQNAGITWQLVRVWEGDHKKEMKLKKFKKARLMCPICNPDTWETNGDI